MRTILAVCCNGAAVDRFSNTLSLFEVIEEIQPSTYPAVLPRLIYVVLLERSKDEPSTLDAKIICDVNGKQVLEDDVNIDFQDKLRERHVVTIHGIPVAAPGELRLRLKHRRLRGTAYTIRARPRPHVEPSPTDGEKAPQAEDKSPARKPPRRSKRG